MRSARAVLAVVLFVGAVAAHAQTLRIMVGFPPGGTTDVLARVFAEKLSEALGRPAIVENRPGGSGRIAIVALKASAPDGNTLMIVPDSAITLFPHTVDTPPYDTLNDFVPVAHVGSFETGLAIAPNVPANDLKEWIAWIKADRKRAVYGSPSAGSNQHFLGFMLGEAIGVPLNHIAYKGIGPTINDLMGGHVPAAMLPMAQVAPMAKAGKLRALGHSGGERVPTAPEVPTFKELGFPALTLSGWYLIIAPAGVRPDIVARYNELVNQAMRTQVVRERMRSQDLEVHEMAPAQIAARLKTEYDRWAPVVKASGFKTTPGL